MLLLNFALKYLQVGGCGTKKREIHASRPVQYFYRYSQLVVLANHDYRAALGGSFFAGQYIAQEQAKNRPLADISATTHPAHLKTHSPNRHNRATLI